jgi:hypothetical protein
VEEFQARDAQRVDRSEKNRLYDLRLEYYDTRARRRSRCSGRAPSRGQTKIATTRTFAYDTRSATYGDYGREAVRGGRGRRRRPAADVEAAVRDTNGDNNYENGAANTIDLRTSANTFPDFIGNYQGQTARGAGEPVLPRAGQSRLEHGGRAAEPRLSSSLPGNERYYDLRRGSVHFFMLDSDDARARRRDGGIETGAVAEVAVADAGRRRSGSSSCTTRRTPSGTEASTRTMRWPFAEWGADVVIAGHSHITSGWTSTARRTS